MFVDMVLRLSLLICMWMMQFWFAILFFSYSISKLSYKTNFAMNDHGVVHHILGIQILHNEQVNTLFLTQDHYV